MNRQDIVLCPAYFATQLMVSGRRSLADTEKTWGEKWVQKSATVHEWSKMLMLAFVVGISSEVKFTAITSGFIIAMSVLMMNLFLYSFESDRPLPFILSCSIISPFVRLINELYTRHDLSRSLMEVIPDAVFFMVYAIVYYILYYQVFLWGKDGKKLSFDDFLRRYNRQYGGIASQKRYVPEKCNNISYDRGCFMYCFLEDDHYTGDRCSHRTILESPAAAWNGWGI